MFRIDHSANRITRLQPLSFGDLGFSERDNLQEWLANQPDAFGEELLIIQKEFAGWNDTKERLDLLALDREGNLVVIENKLDDSGRDVVWQGLKYASYCSTLSKTSIAEVYQQFIDRSGMGGTAEERICLFLEQEDFTEVSLNTGNDQRLIMVAAQYRKEVTSTVLWLLKHKIRLHCFKATPYRDGDSLFLNLEQVLPIPEAEELMIGIADKEMEEHSTERGQATRHGLRTDFWRQILDALEQAGVDLYENISPGRDHWLNAGSGLAGIHYTMIFGKNEARVELGLTTASKDNNKAFFDHLHARREKIEQRFGKPLDWRRMDEKKASLIVSAQSFDGYDRANWPQMIDWLVTHVSKLETTFAPELGSLRNIRAGMVRPTAARPPNETDPSETGVSKLKR